MNKLIIKSTNAYKVEIFIAGNLLQAENICRAFCDEVGLCVTVDETNYIFTGGSEMGVRVGLINYARFPKTEHDVWNTAVELAHKLKEGLNQGSFTVQDHNVSAFYSTRDQDQE